MEIEKEEIGGITQITFSGRLDAAAAGPATKSLEDWQREGGRNLRLDLSTVEYLSSAGIRVLVSTAKKLHEIGGSFQVSRASTVVENVLNLAGFASLMQFEAKEETDEPIDVVQNEWMRCEVYQLKAGIPFRWKALGSRVGEAPHHSQFREGIWMLGTRAADEAAAVPPGACFAIGGVLFFESPHDGIDYLSESGRLIPEAEILEGLVLKGQPTHLLRFEARERSAGISISEPLSTAAKFCDEEALAFVVAGETIGPGGERGFAVLVGVACEKGNKVFEAAIRPHVEGTPFSLEMTGAAFAFHLDAADDSTPRVSISRLLEEVTPRELLRPASEDEIRFVRGKFWYGAATPPRVD